MLNKNEVEWALAPVVCAICIWNHAMLPELRRRDPRRGRDVYNAAHLCTLPYDGVLPVLCYQRDKQIEFDEFGILSDIIRVSLCVGIGGRRSLPIDVNEDCSGFIYLIKEEYRFTSRVFIFISSVEL